MRLTHPHPVALRWAAAFALLRVVLLWIAFIFTAIALLANHQWLTPALILIGAAVAVSLAAFLSSLGLRCTVCRCTLFLPKTCEKHRAAQKFLGSRLLRMSLDVLFSRSFRCVYCGERCGCRKPSQEFLYKPDLPSHADTYKSLWQKPPQPDEQLPPATADEPRNPSSGTDARAQSEMS